MEPNPGPSGDDQLDLTPPYTLVIVMVILPARGEGIVPLAYIAEYEVPREGDAVPRRSRLVSREEAENIERPPWARIFVADMSSYNGFANYNISIEVRRVLEMASDDDDDTDT